MASQVKASRFITNLVKQFNQAIEVVKVTHMGGLLQQKQYRITKLLCYKSSSFENNRDDKTQLRYFILLADESGNVSWLQFSICTSTRVVRSVLRRQTYILSHAFDSSFMTEHDLSKRMNKTIDFTMLTDSMSLVTITKAKQLLIDVKAASGGYEQFDIRHLGWVRMEKNIANGITKRAHFLHSMQYSEQED